MRLPSLKSKLKVLERDAKKIPTSGTKPQVKIDTYYKRLVETENVEEVLDIVDEIISNEDSFEF